MGRQTFLPSLYRTAMRFTGRRGSHTLGRLNASLFRQGQTITLNYGERFYLPPDPHFFGYLIGHEPHVSGIIAEYVHAGDTVFDIGANIGYFSVQMARCTRPQGRVVAYEVDRTNLRFLKRNVALSAGEGGAIEVVEAGVSSAPGTLTLDRGAESTLHKVVRGAGAGVTVPAVSIDGEVGRLGIDHIDFLKIDVEGHEHFVLQGMDRTVRAGRVRAMVVEVAAGEVAAAVDAKLQSWGERVSRVAAFVGGSWREVRVKELVRRSDVVVEFR